MTKRAKLLLSVAGYFTAFLLLDFLISVSFIIGSRFDRYREGGDINRTSRISHDIFHHTFRAKFDGLARWGPQVYPIRTNSIGFLDQTARDVATTPTRPRIVFIGDSFTEGLGLPWEKTFVGLLSRSLPEYEVLNGGVTSYSPSAYYAKIKWLVDQGYSFEHVIVMIDISDIQDETAYAVRDGRVVDVIEAGGGGLDGVDDQKKLESAGWAQVRRSLQRRFQISMAFYHFFRGLLSRENRTAAREDIFNRCRSAWTYDRGSSATEQHYQLQNWKKIDHLATCRRSPKSDHGPNHIDAAILRAAERMNALHELLAAKGIQLSVGVYPWPAQLHHNDLDSLQVRTWEAWCNGKCAHFVNMFSDFFEYKARSDQDWYSTLFFEGDVHFNELGNRIIADKIHRVLKSGVH